MALAMERDQTAYSSLLMVAGAVLADPEPMLARLVRGCIAMAFTARVPAVACIDRVAERALCAPTRGNCSRGRGLGLGTGLRYIIPRADYKII